MSIVGKKTIISSNIKESNLKNQTKINQINKKIAEKKERLKNIKGTETEVYTRIVGYYRPYKNWNNGQKEQYKHRKPYKLKENS